MNEDIYFFNKVNVLHILCLWTGPTKLPPPQPQVKNPRPLLHFLNKSSFYDTFPN